MPEGDSVWRTARMLDRALTGQVLTRTDFRVPAHATTDLAGQTVTGTLARGKHLLTRIGEDHTLHTHLKMEGSWRVFRPGQRWNRPAHTARVVLTTAAAEAVGFSLGIVELLPRSRESEPVAHLGPDLLGPDWDEEEAVRRLLATPDRPIGEALLDQTNLAGLGTVYVAEVLFLSGVSPYRALAHVPDLPAVVRRARKVLMAMRDLPVRATTGSLRRGEQYWVYGRAGEPCRRCGTPILSGRLGTPPRDRIGFWCPSCQP